VQVSTGSLKNPRESNEAASAGQTEFVPSVDGPSASNDGDPPRTGHVGPEAASDLEPHLLVVSATLIVHASPGLQRSAMPPSEPASGGVENLFAHSPAQCSSDEVVLASVLNSDPPGAMRLATDTLPWLQQSAEYSPSSATTMHDLAMSMIRLAKGIVQPRKFIDGTIWYNPKCSFSVTSPQEPRCLADALDDLGWKEAMNSEFSDLLRNKTWHLVSPSQAQNIINSKWVYKVKTKDDGSVDR
jgi:hypothetical protein